MILTWPGGAITLGDLHTHPGVSTLVRSALMGGPTKDNLAIEGGVCLLMTAH